MRNLFLLILMAGALPPAALEAAVVVGPEAVIQTFDAAPPVSDWSTAFVPGSDAQLASVAEVDAAIQALPAAQVSTVLPSSGINPPAVYSLVRFNFNLTLLQSKPSGMNCAATLLLATLVNQSGGPVAALRVAYDQGLFPGFASAVELPGFRVYYSRTGQPGEWQLIPELSTPAVGARETILDLDSWADGAPLYLLWADDNARDGSDPANTIDNFFASVFTGERPVRLNVEPASTTVTEGRPVTFAVQAAGAPPFSYQWSKDSVPIPGATAMTYTIVQTTPADAGAYQVQVSNPVSSLTSSNAVLTILPDTAGPVLLSAEASGWTNLTTMTLVFDESLDPVAASEPAHYTLAPDVAITEATLVNGHTVQLGIGAPFGTHFIVTVSEAVMDRFGHPMGAPDNQRDAASVLILSDWGAPWSYDASGVDQLAAGYLQPDFDDLAWPVGGGLFGVETTAATLAFLAANTTNPPMNTLLAATTNTAYFRATVPWPYASGSLPFAQMQVRYVVDDGLVMHLNGSERFRAFMGAGAVTHTTLATEREATTIGTHLFSPDLLVTGPNVFAVNVHPGSGNSPDAVFGAQILTLHPAVPPVRIMSLPPTNQVVLQAGEPFSLAFAVTGFQPQFQWFKDGVPVPGATTDTYGALRSTLADAGNYTLQVTNIHPSATNSPGIQVTILSDTVPPVLVSAEATGTTNLTSLTLVFSEPLATTTAGNPADYTLTPFAPITGVTVVNETTLRLSLQAPFGAQYVVTVGAEVTDLAGNPIEAPGNRLEVASQLVLADWGAPWKYDARNIDLLAAGYMQPAFNDAAWPEGPGLFGLETVEVSSSSTFVFLRNNTTNPPMNTVLPAATNTTVYFRKTIAWPFAPGTLPGVQMMVRYVADDGLVWHLNGTERFRAFLAEGLVTHTTLAPNHEADAISTNLFSSDLLLAGENVFAVNLHPASATSSDGVFGAQILAVLPRPGLCEPLAITAQPVAAQTVTRGSPVSFAVDVAGTGPYFQWFKDNLPLPAAQQSSYTMASATLADAGAYSCVISNACTTPALTSQVAVLTVIADDLPPQLLVASATGTTNLTTVTLQFSEALAPATAGQAAHYAIFPATAITDVTLVSTNTVRLAINAPFGPFYSIAVSAAVTDRAGNPLASPGSYRALPSSLLWLDWGADWKFDVRNSDLLAAGFMQPDFDDSTWLAGPGLWGVETTADTLTFLAANTTNPPLNTALQPATTNTAYFRRAVTWPYAAGALPAGAQVVVRYVMDDGLALYLNGGLQFSAFLPVGPVTHATLAYDHEAAEINTNAFTAGLLQPGTNVLAVNVHPASRFSSDAVFGAQVLVVIPPITPVQIVSLPPTNHFVIPQGEPFSLAVGVTGWEPQCQWFKDGVAVPGATTAGFNQPLSTLADAGYYSLQVTNLAPSGTNSPVVQVTIIPDETPPALLAAVRQFDMNQVLATFSEGVNPAQATNPANYTIYLTANPAVTVPVMAVTLGAGNTTAILVTAIAVPARCTLVIANVSDLAGNPVTPNRRSITTVSGFQEGGAGYIGTVDTFVRADQPDTASGNLDSVTVDGQYPLSHGLLQFDDLVGAEAGQIPVGATVLAATLRLRTANLSVDTIRMHRLLAAWSDASTWNSLGGQGVTNLVLEPPDAVVNPVVTEAYVELDVTASVRAWVSGTENHGWGFINLGTDGWVFNSSEAVDLAWRPALVVDWSPAPTVPALTIHRPADGTITLAWDPADGRLQAADNPAGPWMDVDGATNPITLPITGTARKFYSLRQP